MCLFNSFWFSTTEVHPSKTLLDQVVMSNIKCSGVEHDIRKCQFNNDYSSTCKNTVVLKCLLGEYVFTHYILKHQQQVHYKSSHLFSTFLLNSNNFCVVLDVNCHLFILNIEIHLINLAIYSEYFYTISFQISYWFYNVVIC